MLTRLSEDPREIDFEARPFPDLAVHPNAPAALLHNAVDGGEPQPRALPGLLGGEERLEEACFGSLVHPDSSVGDGEHHVRTRCCTKAPAGILLVELHIRCLDGEASPSGHGIARV